MNKTVAGDRSYIHANGENTEQTTNEIIFTRRNFLNANSNVYHAITNLWMKFYSKKDKNTGKPYSTNTRIELVEEFLNVYFRPYATAERTKDILYNTKIKHPEHSHGSFERSEKKASISDILTDFISYEIREEALTTYQQKENEVTSWILSNFGAEMEDEGDGNFGEGYFVQNNPEMYPSAEDSYFIMQDERTRLEVEETGFDREVEEFRKVLQAMKENVKATADKVSKTFDRDYQETLKGIRRLKPDNVKRCVECDTVFMARDFRIMTCGDRCKKENTLRKQRERDQNARE